MRSTRSLLLLVLASVTPLASGGITPDNPTGVYLSYGLAWLNPSTGNFGGNLTVQELQPSTPAANFSLKFFFDRPDTLIQDYWGDVRITHYQSGAYHVQPGPGPQRVILFNGLYNTSVANSNASFAMPSAIALLKGYDYTAPEVAFQRDDVRVVPLTAAMAAALPTAPFGPFIRPERTASTTPSTSSANQSGEQVKADASSPMSGNTAYFIGGGVGAAVLAAIVVGLVAIKRRNSGKKEVKSDVVRKGSFRGMVNQGAVEPHVQHTSPVTVTGPMDYIPPMTAASHDSVSRQQEQLDFVEQYASVEFRDEMDEAVAHSAFGHNDGAGYYAAESTTSHSYSSQDMIGRIEEEEKRLQLQLDSAGAMGASMTLGSTDDRVGAAHDDDGDEAQYAMAYEAVEFHGPSSPTTARHHGANYI